MGTLGIYYSFIDSTNIYQAWSIKGAKFLNSKIHKTVLTLSRITIQLLYLTERMMSSTQVTPLVVYLNSLKSET